MIIGICASAGSGKDTVAEYLKPFGTQTISLADEIKRFCMKVYDFSEEQLWGPSEFRNKPDERYPRKHTWALQSQWDATCACCGAKYESGADIPQCYLTPRYALQRLGTEWGRDCYDKTWVDNAIRDAKVVLSDMYARYYRTKGIVKIEASDNATTISAALGKAHVVIIPDVRFLNEVEGITGAGGQVWFLDRPGAGLSGAQAQHRSESELLTIPKEAFTALIHNDSTLDNLRVKVLAEAKRIGLCKELLMCNTCSRTTVASFKAGDSCNACGGKLYVHRFTIED